MFLIKQIRDFRLHYETGSGDNVCSKLTYSDTIFSWASLRHYKATNSCRDRLVITLTLNLSHSCGE